MNVLTIYRVVQGLQAGRTASYASVANLGVLISALQKTVMLNPTISFLSITAIIIKGQVEGQPVLQSMESEIFTWSAGETELNLIESLGAAFVG